MEKANKKGAGKKKERSEMDQTAPFLNFHVSERVLNTECVLPWGDRVDTVIIMYIIA